MTTTKRKRTTREFRVTQEIELGTVVPAESGDPIPVAAMRLVAEAVGGDGGTFRFDDGMFEFRIEVQPSQN